MKFLAGSSICKNYENSHVVGETMNMVDFCFSRRWNKEQKIGSPVFGYMPTGGSTVKTPVVGAPPYQVSIEDRLRWAQIADAMAHANHYGVSILLTTLCT